MTRRVTTETAQMAHCVIMGSIVFALAVGCAGTPTTTTDTRATDTRATPLSHGDAVRWAPWAPSTFARAKAEDRLLIVTVVTEWCHWCHVMDQRTWGDPDIAALVDARFVAIRVDADARPDLAERYLDHGWPAIALLTPDAQPITEWKGYQEARRFESQLLAYLKDKDEGRSLQRTPVLIQREAKPLATIRDFTRAQLDRFYDPDEGGWGRPQKYPLWAAVSAGLFAAVVRGEEPRLKEVTTTLDGELNLIDTVDGGMFQYSLQAVWTAPHYEKLAEIQGPAMENYADAWARTGDVQYRRGAFAIARYVRTVLRRADGAFFANQDADVGTRGDVARVLGVEWYGLPTREARAARGEPFIDRHVYASHNGRLIAGLARLGMLTEDRSLIDDAARATDVILQRHRVGDAFSHDEGAADDDVLHLADQTAMGQALLTLHEATGAARYRAAAVGVATFLIDTLEDKVGGGFFAHTPVKDDVGVFAERRKPYKGNAEAARFLLKVGRLQEDNVVIAAAERALVAFAVERLVKEEFRAVGEMLLALEEHLVEPLRFTVVGDDDDKATLALLRAAGAVYTPHRIIEVLQPGVKYPDLGAPSLYICTSTFCSPPIQDPAVVAKKATRYLAPPSPPPSPWPTIP